MPCTAAVGGQLRHSRWAPQEADATLLGCCSQHEALAQHVTPVLAGQAVLGSTPGEGTSAHQVRHTVVSIHAHVLRHAHSSCHRRWRPGGLRHCSSCGSWCRSRHWSAGQGAPLPLPYSQRVAVLQWQLRQRGCCVSRELQAVGERSLQDLKQPGTPAMPL